MNTLEETYLQTTCEDFFVQRIRHGLSAMDLELTSEEEKLLMTPVMELAAVNDESIRLRARALTMKCVGALSTAYARQTAGRNSDSILQWRQNIDALYKHSRRVISAVVQEWYLSTGRSQEKSASGWISKIPMFLLGVVVLLAIGWFLWSFL